MRHAQERFWWEQAQHPNLASRGIQYEDQMMPRLPFNPDRVPPAKDIPPKATSRGGLFGGESDGDKPGGGKNDKDQPITVTQLAALIKDAIVAASPGRLRVVGEVSNFSQRSHWFFSLKDQGASIRCVCFASSARRISFPVEDGMQVVASGRLDFFDAAGNVQLYVDSLQPVGQGALEMRFRALCEELRQLGYFDPDRKKPLPAMPRRVAVVTSRSAAALQDVINTARKRWAGCELMLFDVRVQGSAAAPEIANALDALSKHGPRMGIDAIILTRGGGSIEDLWAFNERVVADAIFRCALPIIAAIGHETDTTVAELVADVRASTPTQAAMTLIPDRYTLDQQVQQLSHRLALVLRRQAESSRHRLDAAARHPLFRRPGDMLQPHADRLASLMGRLRLALPQRVRGEVDHIGTLERRFAPMLTRRVMRDAERLTALSRQLEAVGPGNVLRRGYTYTLGPDGQLLRSAAGVSPGDRLISVLADGRVSSTVTDADATASLPKSTAPLAPRGKRGAKTRINSTGDQPGLFADGGSSSSGDSGGGA